MEWYFILLICVGAAAVFCALSLFALSLYAYRTAFGSRCDKNPLLTYFSAGHFGLDCKKVNIVCGKLTLRGGLYRRGGVGANGGLVIFCHGMGAGHAAYMTEINYFCGKGFSVLAIDNRGCDLSDGKSIKGLYSGVEAAKAAYDFAKSDEELKDMDVFFAGHSWGGYSALCACAEREVQGVVAISAPLSPAGAICGVAAGVLPKFLAAAMRPFAAACDFFAFGSKANKNAAKCVEKSRTPALIIHGDRDTTVPLKCSAYAKAEGKNIKKLLAKGKAHNPYNTPKAQEMMIELTQNLSAARKMDKEQLGYFAGFDYAAATEEDDVIMQAMADFMLSAQKAAKK